MAIQDNTVLPAPTSAAGGMPPEIAAFLQMLMGGRSLPGGLGALLGGGGQQGAVPFGGPGQGFGNFLMNNPGLMQSLFGLPPQGAVPGAAAPGQDATPVGPAVPATPAAAPVTPTTPSQITDPAAATPATPAGTPVAPTGSSPLSPGASAFGSVLSGLKSGEGFQSVLPLLRKG